jgi:hypothetical protein
MADALEPRASEHFMVDIFEVTQDDVDRVRLRDAFQGRMEYHGFTAGKYARLSHRNPDGSRGATIMSDTWMEQQTNVEFCEQAKGDVLVGGLGLGMVLLAIQDKPEVRTITVVEKEAEVIALIKDQLPLNATVTIVQGDIFTYKPDKAYNVIYCDIWDTISGDNWPEMKKLHRRLRKWLKPKGYMASWRQEPCRIRHKEDV